MPLLQIRLLRALDEAKNASTPPSQILDGVDNYLEHETGLELLGGYASSPPRWQGDAGREFIEVFRSDRSYRAVSINSGGSAGGGNRTRVQFNEVQ